MSSVLDMLPSESTTNNGARTSSKTMQKRMFQPCFSTFYVGTKSEWRTVGRLPPYQFPCLYDIYIYIVHTYLYTNHFLPEIKKQLYMIYIYMCFFTPINPCKQTLLKECFLSSLPSHKVTLIILAVVSGLIP